MTDDTPDHDETAYRAKTTFDWMKRVGPTLGSIATWFDERNEDPEDWLGGVAERFDQLEAENQQLRDELTALRLRLPERSDTDPVDLSFDEKILMVREQAYRRAADSVGGRVALDASDVRWGMFDGEVSIEPCYRLVRRAAGYGDDGVTRIEDVPGFELLTDPIRLGVNTENVDPKASVYGFGPTKKGASK